MGRQLVRGEDEGGEETEGRDACVRAGLCACVLCVEREFDPRR